LVLAEIQPGIRVRVKSGNDWQFTSLAAGVLRNQDLVLLTSRPALHFERPFQISQNEPALLGSGLLPRERLFPCFEKFISNNVFIDHAQGRYSFRRQATDYVNRVAKPSPQSHYDV
jgi:hypothetical protein